MCRKCDIHPAVLDGYMDGATLRGEEAAVVDLIEHRLRKRGRDSFSWSAVKKTPGPFSWVQYSDRSPHDSPE